jgi:ribosomal protein S18 acetylase RimI-like enzyme
MKDPFDFFIRPITRADQSFLWEALYHAIYVPEGSDAPPSEIVNAPELSRYVSGWGLPGDTGLIAVDANSDRPVAAVWLRLMKGENRGYGYVDDDTPELSIAALPGYRGRGLGTRLMAEILKSAEQEYRAVSLSVSEQNPAVRLYRRLGFEALSDRGGSLTMLKILSDSQSPPL